NRRARTPRRGSLFAWPHHLFAADAGRPRRRPLHGLPAAYHQPRADRRDHAGADRQSRRLCRPVRPATREPLIVAESVILTCALTGSIHTPTMSPHLPVTADDMVEQAVAAAEAGASILHLHARDPLTGRPSAEVEDFMG